MARYITFTVFLVMILALSACIENPEYRGFTTSAVPFDKVIVGTSTREDVRTLLGSPSSVSSFGDETWYYISTFHVRKASFMTTENRQQKIVAIVFDDAGVVSHIGGNAGEANRPIEFADDVTPTEGNEITVMQQLLGNFGKFNKSRQGQ